MAMPIHESGQRSLPGGPSARSSTFLIEVWADIACPWCYIGERRLQHAIARVAAEAPEVGIVRRWRPFQLQPGIPASGVPWAEFAARKFGARGPGMFSHVTEVGAADDIHFRFDRVHSAPNTRDAHRLVLWAAEQSREWAMADALFRAYFTEGRNLNDHVQLGELARSAGLEETAARDFLATTELLDAVDASQREAALVGVNGVPFFVLDERYAFSGAQPVEAIASAIRTALRDTGTSATP